MTHIVVLIFGRNHNCLGNDIFDCNIKRGSQRNFAISGLIRHGNDLCTRGIGLIAFYLVTVNGIAVVIFIFNKQAVEIKRFANIVVGLAGD